VVLWLRGISEKLVPRKLKGEELRKRGGGALVSEFLLMIDVRRLLVVGT
jgi:hypothetical protein